VHAGNELTTTAAPTVEQLAIITALDPAGIRHKQLSDNPMGDRR